MDERYITTYTVNVANTWEKKIITIPGDTRSGKNISPSNGYGLEVKWVWMSGSNRVATPNTWATQGNKYGASGVTLANIFSSTSNNLYLTGCQLEVGTTATEFEHRSYGEELERCKRYFYKWNADGDSGSTYFLYAGAYSSHANSAFFDYTYQPEMRAIPSATTPTANNQSGGSWSLYRYRARWIASANSSGSGATF